MSILSSLILATLLALPINNNSNLLNLNFSSLSITIVLYLFVIMASIKLLVYMLSFYISKFNNYWATTNKSSLCYYLECLMFYLTFQSNSFKEIITQENSSTLTDSTLNILTKLSASILLPFSGLSILIIIVCAAINSYQDKNKALIFKELNIICSSLLLILGITLIIENLNL